MAVEPPLRDRKKLRAQQAIVDAAFALFSERGFANVTVTEIAERAEVGRTTFFRYFGDKQEVVFADEQRLVDELLHQSAPAEPPAPIGFRSALDIARAAARQLCQTITADPVHYRQHVQLVADHPELHDRSERKSLRLTDALAGMLRAQGSPPKEAELVAHLALSCVRVGRSAAGDDPGTLADSVDDAFAMLLDNTG